MIPNGSQFTDTESLTASLSVQQDTVKQITSNDDDDIDFLLMCVPVTPEEDVDTSNSSTPEEGIDMSNSSFSFEEFMRKHNKIDKIDIEYKGELVVIGDNLNGSGGEVSVFRGVLLNADVIVKTIIKKKFNINDSQAFESEVACLKAMNQYIHDGGLEKTTYIIEKLVPGNMLSESIKDISVDEKAKIILQLFLSLQDVMQEGIIHRDIKPENTMIYHSQDKKLLFVSLIDYGVSAISTSIDAYEETIVGTRPYMAPESIPNNLGNWMQCINDAHKMGIWSSDNCLDDLRFPDENGEIDLADITKYNEYCKALDLKISGYSKSSDVFSVGRTAMYVLSGGTKEGAKEILSEQANEKAKNIVKILNKMTEINPNERCSINEAIKSLKELLSEDEVYLLEKSRQLSKILQSINPVERNYENEQKVANDIINLLASVCQDNHLDLCKAIFDSELIPVGVKEIIEGNLTSSDYDDVNFSLGREIFNKVRI